jgi:hypothetical protein
LVVSGPAPANVPRRWQAAERHDSFSETGHTENLKRFDVATLYIHGDDDQIVPIASALLKSQVNEDLAGAPGASRQSAKGLEDRCRRLDRAGGRWSVGCMMRAAGGRGGGRTTAGGLRSRTRRAERRAGLYGTP